MTNKSPKEIIFPSCGKVHGIRPQIDQETAIIYAKLRNDGCPKKAARMFSTHTVCKSDPTKKYDGPRNFKTLKTKKDPSIKAINGWIYGPLQYSLGKNFYLSSKDILLDKDSDDLFTNHFHKHEKRIKEDYKKKIENLKKFFHEIDEQCNLSKLSKKELLTRLKTEREKYKMKRSGSEIFQESQISNSNIFKHDYLDVLKSSFTPVNDSKKHITISTNNMGIPTNNLGMSTNLTSPQNICCSNITETNINNNTYIIINEEKDSERKYITEQGIKTINRITNEVDYLNNLVDSSSQPCVTTNRHQRKLNEIKPIRTNSSIGILSKNKEIADEFNKMNYIFALKQDIKKSDKEEGKQNSNNGNNASNQNKISKATWDEILSIYMEQENHYQKANIDFENLYRLKVKHDQECDLFERRISRLDNCDKNKSYKFKSLTISNKVKDKNYTINIDTPISGASTTAFSTRRSIHSYRNSIPYSLEISTQLSPSMHFTTPKYFTARNHISSRHNESNINGNNSKSLFSSVNKKNS